MLSMQTSHSFVSAKNLNLTISSSLKILYKKKLNKHCDGLEKTEIYQKHYTHQETTATTKGTIMKKAACENDKFQAKPNFFTIE